MAMVDDFGESKVTVKRVGLLEALVKNRETHTKDYAEAYEGFKVAFVQDAEKLLAQAKAGDFTKAAVHCSPPQDHTKDYDRVIRMMEMSTADEIVVSEQQFSQYVLDEWSWQRDFAATKMRYSNANNR